MAYWDPFEEMQKMHEEMERIFRGPRAVKLLGDSKELAVRNPLTDLQETDKSVIATFEIPGAKKEDVKLDVTEDSIEVRAGRKVESEEKTDSSYGYKSVSRNYFRKMSLPTKVDANNATAIYNDGVLKVVMPKIKQGENKKRISID